MNTITIPATYHADLNLHDTQIAIKTVKDQKSSGAGWIIWFIVTLAILLPKLWDFLADWIGTNL